jgi:hypothetical protein
MKKLLLFSAMLFACIFTVSAQYQRQVLVEEFTNASCPPCAGQNPAFNALLDAAAPKVTPIKYQTNWPGVDPMNAQNAAHVATRVSYYGVTGVPNAFMDGVGILNDCAYYDNAPACLTADEIDAQYGTTSPVKIVLSHSLTADYDSILISVAVTSDIALTGTLRLHVAVVEDEINFNAAPGTNGELEFFQVMRRMLPNGNGTTTGNFAAGETKSYNFAWPITYAYDLNKLCAASWLQINTTKAVFNSARTTPIGGIADADVNILNTMNPFVCTAGLSPTFTLENTGTAPITSASLRYRVGGTGVWTNKEWTGNIAAGASEVITLSEVSIVNNGTTKVEVRVDKTNNGIKTDLIRNLVTMNIKALLDGSTALPYESDFEAATVPPAGWSVANAGANGWLVGAIGAGGSAGSAKNNFYDYQNATTDLYSPKMDLSLAAGTTTLTFDHAYTWYVDATQTFYDSLSIGVSTDCGATWANVFYDGGESLATAPATGASYAPVDDAEWRNNTVDLSAYNGVSDVLVRFSAISGYGNNLYLDNVNLTTVSGVKNLDLSSFTLAPNPTKDLAEVRFGLPTAQSIQLKVYNNLGSLVQTMELGELASGNHTVSVNALRLNAGSYRVVLQGKDGIAQTQMIVLK